MSQFIYNNIEFKLVKTNSVERIARHSDDKSQYMWTDFIIDLQFIYNPAATSYLPGAVQSYGQLPMVTDTSIRFYLLQPRQPLLYEEGGIVILSIQSNLPNGGAIDCENGP